MVEKDPCLICLDDLNASDAVRLPCKHSFHPDCINEWAQKNQGEEVTCPKCRAPLSKEILQEIQRPLRVVDVLLIFVMLIVMGFQKTFGGLSKAGKFVFSQLKRFLIRLKSFVLNFGPEVRAAMAALSQQLKRIANTVKNFFVTVFQKTFGALGKKIVEFFSAIKNAIASRLSSLLHSLSKVLKNSLIAVINFVKRNLTALFSSVKRLVLALAGKLSSALKFCVTKLKLVFSKIGNLLEFCVSKVKLALAKLGNLLIAVGKALLDPLRKAWQFTTKVTLDFLAYLNYGLRKLELKVYQLFHYVWLQVTTLAKKLSDALTFTYAKFSLVLTKSAQKCKQLIVKAWNSTISLLGTLVRYAQIPWNYAQRGMLSAFNFSVNQLHKLLVQLAHAWNFTKQRLVSVSGVVAAQFNSFLAQCKLAYYRVCNLMVTVAKSCYAQLIVPLARLAKKAQHSVVGLLELTWKGAGHWGNLIFRNLTELRAIFTLRVSSVARKLYEVLQTLRVWVVKTFDVAMLVMAKLWLPLKALGNQVLDTIESIRRSGRVKRMLKAVAFFVRSVEFKVYGFFDYVALLLWERLVDVAIRGFIAVRHSLAAQWENSKLLANTVYNKALVPVGRVLRQGYLGVVSNLQWISLTFTEKFTASLSWAYANIKRSWAFVHQKTSMVVNYFWQPITQFYLAANMFFRKIELKVYHAIDRLLRIVWAVLKFIVLLPFNILAFLYKILIIRPQCAVCHRGYQKIRSLCFTCTVDLLVPRCSECEQGYTKLFSKCFTCAIKPHFPLCKDCNRGFGKLAKKCFTCYIKSLPICQVCNRGYAKLGLLCYRCHIKRIWHLAFPICIKCNRGYAKLGKLCTTCFVDRFMARCLVCARGYGKLGGLCVTCKLDQLLRRCGSCQRGYAKFGPLCLTCKLAAMFRPCSVCHKGYQKFGPLCMTCKINTFMRPCTVCNRGYQKFGPLCMTCKINTLFVVCSSCHIGYAKFGPLCMTCKSNSYFSPCGVCRRGYAKIGPRCITCTWTYLSNPPVCRSCKIGYSKIDHRCISCYVSSKTGLWKKSN